MTAKSHDGAADAAAAMLNVPVKPPVDGIAAVCADVEGVMQNEVLAEVGV